MTGSLKLISKRRALLGDLLTYSPVLVCLLIMLPRLLSPQFGLLDDGVTISAARHVIAGDWSIWNMGADAGTGRFRPAYWLAYSAVYRLSADDPFPFFLANGLVFAGITFGLVCLTRAAGGSRLQAAVAGLLFALSGPAIENFYTLSKGEPFQLLWLVGSLLVIAALPHRRSSLGKTGALLMAAFLVFLADATKETSLAMIPVSLAWWFTGWIRRKANQDRRGFGVRSAYLLATVLATVVYLGLRACFVWQATPADNYAARYSLQLSQILATGFRWAGWLARDFPYLVPLVTLFTVGWLLRKRAAQGDLLLDAVVWMGGWVLVFLPWSAPTVEYFLLPFAAGCSVFSGILIGQAGSAVLSTRKMERFLAVIALVLAAGLLLTTLPNNASNGQQQLAVDAANADMLDYLASSLPPGSVVIVNIQDPNEYVAEIALHLDVIRDRPDLVVDHFSYQEALLSPEVDPPYVVLAPSVENQPRLAVRMGVIEPTVRQWNESMLQFLGGSLEVEYETERRFRLLKVDLLRVFCPLFPAREYCHVAGPAIDRRLFSYGWTVYRLAGEAQGSVAGVPSLDRGLGTRSASWPAGARLAPPRREGAR